MNECDLDGGEESQVLHQLAGGKLFGDRHLTHRRNFFNFEDHYHIIFINMRLFYLKNLKLKSTLM
jgi:hypothetical protein